MVSRGFQCSTDCSLAIASRRQHNIGGKQELCTSCAHQNTEFSCYFGSAVALHRQKPLTLRKPANHSGPQRNLLVSCRLCPASLEPTWMVPLQARCLPSGVPGCFSQGCFSINEAFATRFPNSAVQRRMCTVIVGHILSLCASAHMLLA